MTKIQKLNKALIGVIIITIFAYLLQIINLSFFANDFSEITNMIQMITNFIPNENVQNINAIIDFANNTTSVIRGFLVTASVVSAVSSVALLSLVKVFANRLDRYKSVFTYCGLLITSAVSGYLQLQLFPSFDGLISLILILATMLIIASSIACIGVALVGLYRVITSEQFNAAAVGFDFAKVLSFILIFYVGVIIVTKVSLYMSAVVLVQGIDLAAMIDVMDYINVDWEAILPPVVLSTGVVTADRINLLINNAADQYLLSYLSTVIQNFILTISRTIIFDNIIAYVSALVSSIAVLYTVKHKFDYRNYVAIGLMVLILVITFVYIGGLIANLLAIGFVGCIVLVAVDIYKQYKV